MTACRRILLIALLLVFFGGCGGAGDKGKNKDKDVPKAAEAPAK